MISGIDSSAIAMGGNLSALKKAMDSEANIMGSLLNGMDSSASNLQTQQTPPPAQDPQNTTVQSTNKLDIMA